MKLTIIERDKVTDWLFGDDKGMSSMYLAYLFTSKRKRIGSYPHHPIDPSDFGRCYRFIEKCVGAKNRKPLLALAAKKDIHWKNIADNWEALEKLWIEERNKSSAPKLWDMMKKLGL